MFAFPDGQAPLTGLLSLLKEEPTDDPLFNFYEKPFPLQRSVLTAAYSNVATTIAVAAAVFRIGHLIMNETTEEIMKVSGISANGLTLTVTRGHWGTAVASSVSYGDDAIVIIGNCNPEGGDTPQILTMDPNPYANYTQIFRTACGQTGTAKKTVMRYDESGPAPEDKREALMFHSIEMEKAFIHGKKAQWLNAVSGKVERTTSGIVEMMQKNSDVTDNIITVSGGNLTKALLNEYVRRAMTYKLGASSEKLVLAGSKALSVINTLAMNNGTINLVPTDEAFGLKCHRWNSPHGDLVLMQHPLLSVHPVWTKWMLILDVAGLKYRYMEGRDTTFLPNQQAKGADQQVGEYLTECGLELHHPEAFMLLKNVNAAA